MRVALVHDDLVQWGGAERVLLGLCEVFPNAPIFTSVFDGKNINLKKNFSNKKIITSFLQKIPLWRKFYKAFLPLYPLAFEQFNFDDFDLVISQTTRFAKSILTKPKTLHVCYCHTPPRFLWRFSGIKNYGIGELIMSKLRLYDQISAKRVDYFIAGSKNAKKRISKIYKVNALVIPPFIDFERFKNIETFDGGYFVVLGRNSTYKRFDLAKNVCESLKVDLKVIDGELTDEGVIKILAGCKALIIPGEEDFGLTSLEAQALGKPVIAYKGGGALETIIEGESGIYFEAATFDSLKNALVRFSKMKFNADECRQNAKKFGKEYFIKDFKQTIASLL